MLMQDNKLTLQQKYFLWESTSKLDSPTHQILSQDFFHHLHQLWQSLRHQNWQMLLLVFHKLVQVPCSDHTLNKRE